MSSYRYVIFPRGRQPSADEVRKLESFSGSLAGQFAWGVSRDDGRLAIALDARAYDHLQASDAGFAALVELWQTHGCELADRLGFVKNSAALKPAPAATLNSAGRARSSPPADKAARQGHAAEHPAPPSPHTHAAAKTLLAHEAIADSLLGVQRSLERYNATQRFAAAFPYLLMLAGAPATAAIGLSIRSRLADSGRPPRRQIIERAASDRLEASSPDEESPQDGGAPAPP